MSGAVSDSGAYPQVSGHIQLFWDDEGMPLTRLSVEAVRRPGEEWPLSGSVALSVDQAQDLFSGRSIALPHYGLMYAVDGIQVSRAVESMQLNVDGSTGRATLALTLGSPVALLADGDLATLQTGATASFQGRFSVACVVTLPSGAAAFDMRFETEECRSLADEVGLASTSLMPLD